MPDVEEGRLERPEPSDSGQSIEDSRATSRLLWRRAIDLSAVGIAFPIALVIGYILGRELGELLGYPVAGRVVGGLVGAAAGFRNLLLMAGRKQ